MKLNIIREESAARNGYVNVLTHEPGNLGQVAFPGQVEELVVQDVLEYIPLEGVDEAIDQWVNLLATDGKIAVISTDFYEVADALLNNRIQWRDAINLLYGPGRRATYHISIIVAALEARGLIIEHKIVHDLKAT